MQTKTLITAGAGLAAAAALGITGATLASAEGSSANGAAGTSATQGYGQQGQQGYGQQGRVPRGDHGDHGGPGRQMSTQPLTADAASKAITAATAKYSGSKATGVHTEADGTYEVKLIKKDGTRVDVLVSKSFTVTGEETHADRGPGGPAGPQGSATTPGGGGSGTSSTNPSDANGTGSSST